jgi:hypothetical protein
MAKLKLAGYEHINSLAAKYYVNDGLEIDDSSVQVTIERLCELNLAEDEKLWLWRINDLLFN